MSAPRTTYHVFIDASDTRLQEKSSARLKDEDEDLPCKINFEGLLRAFESESRVIDIAFLYGSPPPPNDRVWKSANDYQCNSENEVYMAMVTEIVWVASRLNYSPEAASEKEDAVFVIVSGSRNLIPAVRIVLEYGIPVELWTWKANFSRKYIDLYQDYQSLLSIHVFD